MKDYFKAALFSAVSALILFTGCNKEAPLPGHEEITAAKTTSGTIPETVSESPTEAQTTEPATVTEPKKYEPYQLKLYDSKGTGMPRPDDYDDDSYIYTVRGNYILTLLKDRAAAEKIETEAQDFISYINDKYFPDEDITDETSKKKPHIEYSACNGFLFYSIGFSYNNFPMKCCLVFDIKTGDRLELSDMFFEGEEFLSLLNKKLQEEIQKININSVDYYDYIPIKREFAGLTENGFYFDDNSFYFPADNPYMARYVRLDISLLNFDSVLNVPYDMRSLFEERTDKTVSFSQYKNSITSDSYVYSKHYLTGNIMVHLFEESSYLTKEQTEFLNNAAVSLTKGEAFENIKKEYEWNVYTDDDEIWYYSYAPDELPVVTFTDHYDIKIQAVKNKFANVSIYNSGVNEAYSGYNLYFDLETLELLDTEQIIEYVYGSSNIIWDYVYNYSSETDVDGFIQGEAPDISKLETKYLRYVPSPGLFYEGIYDNHYISGKFKLAEE
ncbi:MAG: hypothetical protein J1F11_00115 [Oscillospiraceae bacterium]|nr:hypothetical protein [Oscillospiraceae bacterium]